MNATVELEVPVISQPFADGVYAGKTIHQDEVFHLVVLPGEFSGTWNDAMTWAKEQGGELPSRFDQLIQWQNLRDEFKETWYWSNTQYAGDDEFAWLQNFYNGLQHDYHEDSLCRARAVRRIPI